MSSKKIDYSIAGKVLFFICALVISKMALAQNFFKLPNLPPSPSDNPITAEKTELGKLLFFDKRLSKDNSVSCNSCHDLANFGVDGLEVSKGIGGKVGKRNSPTVVNSGYLSSQFWDGRAATLEDQAKLPILNPNEMGMESESAIVEKISKIEGYQKLFKTAFADGITFNNIAKAIATFERTLSANKSKYDYYLEGDINAISDSAKKGLQIFRSVQCGFCHGGPNFSGTKYLAEGSAYLRNFPFRGVEASQTADIDLLKKYGIDMTDSSNADTGLELITKNPAHRYVFKVPSLRNVEKTAPYFHSGKAKTLEDAVFAMAKFQLGQTLNDQQVTEVADFLKTLTSDFTPPIEPKIFPQ